MIHLVLCKCLEERKSSVEFFNSLNNFFKGTIEFRDKMCIYVYPAKSCDLLSAIAETNQLVYPLNKHLLNISWVPSQVRDGAPLSAHLPGE